MRVNLDAVREIAESYQATVEHNATEEQRDLNTEALACMIGAAKAMRFPTDDLEGVIRAAVQDARDPVQP